MSGLLEWTPKTASETIIRYADFTDELAFAELLNSAGCVATVWSGNDPVPTLTTSVALANNSAGVSAVAVVTLAGGVLGTIYQCVVTGVTNLNRVITKSAALAIRPPLN
jgi:hypothetical protein